MGGMLGSMLFSRFAGAGTGGMGGGGIGPFDIALLAGIVYLIYRFVKKKRAESAAISDDRRGFQDIAAPLTILRPTNQRAGNGAGECRLGPYPPDGCIL